MLLNKVVLKNSCDNYNGWFHLLAFRRRHLKFKRFRCSCFLSRINNRSQIKASQRLAGRVMCSMAVASLSRSCELIHYDRRYRIELHVVATRQSANRRSCGVELASISTQPIRTQTVATPNQSARGNGATRAPRGGLLKGPISYCRSSPRVVISGFTRPLWGARRLGVV